MALEMTTKRRMALETATKKRMAQEMTTKRRMTLETATKRRMALEMTTKRRMALEMTTRRRTRNQNPEIKKNYLPRGKWASLLRRAHHSCWLLSWPFPRSAWPPLQLAPRFLVGIWLCRNRWNWFRQRSETRQVVLL